MERSPSPAPPLAVLLPTAVKLDTLSLETLHGCVELMKCTMDQNLPVTVSLLVDSAFRVSVVMLIHLEA